TGEDSRGGLDAPLPVAVGTALIAAWTSHLASKATRAGNVRTCDPGIGSASWPDSSAHRSAAHAYRWRPSAVCNKAAGPFHRFARIAAASRSPAPVAS